MKAICQPFFWIFVALKVAALIALEAEYRIEQLLVLHLSNRCLFSTARHVVKGLVKFERRSHRRRALDSDLGHGIDGTDWTLTARTLLVLNRNESLAVIGRDLRHDCHLFVAALLRVLDNHVALTAQVECLQLGYQARVKRVCALNSGVTRCGWWLRDGISNYGDK